MSAHLGYKTVESCQEAIDSQGFAEWRSFYEIDPWGEWRIELAIARLAGLYANSKGAETTVSDWLYRDPDEARRVEAVGHKSLSIFNAVSQFQREKGII